MHRICYGGDYLCILRYQGKSLRRLSEGSDDQWDDGQAAERKEGDEKQARGVAGHYTKKAVGLDWTASRACVEHVYCERARCAYYCNAY